ETRTEDWPAGVVLLRGEAPLVLEGVEVRCWVRNRRAGGSVNILQTSKALHVANCRFLMRNANSHISPRFAGQTEVRNCEFLSSPLYTINSGIHGAWAIRPYFVKPLVVENSLLTVPIFTVDEVEKPSDVSIRLTRNSFVTRGAFQLDAHDSGARRFADADGTVKALRVEASGNLFHTDQVFLFQQHAKVILPPGDAEACLARMASWQGERNLYAVNRA